VYDAARLVEGTGGVERHTMLKNDPNRTMLYGLMAFEKAGGFVPVPAVV
jgi:hypothetical protein